MSERDWLLVGSDAGEHAALLPDDIFPEAPPPALAREWHTTFLSEQSQKGVIAAFALGAGDLAAWLALGRIGAAFADVHLFDGEKGEAPRWRWRLYDDGVAAEEGVEAILLPVDRYGRLVRAFTCDLHEIADVIAIPLASAKLRARSHSGLTPAVGMFDGVETLRLFSHGMRWLYAYVDKARALAGGLSEAGLRAARDELAMPDADCAFVLAPELIDWRRVEARHIACVDSAGLARSIDAALHIKEKPRAMPEVLGPRKAVA